MNSRGSGLGSGTAGAVAAKSRQETAILSTAHKYVNECCIGEDGCLAKP